MADQESVEGPERDSPPGWPNQPEVVRTDTLFHGQREICIEHDGVRYRLRITRRNKLILQK